MHFKKFGFLLMFWLLVGYAAFAQPQPLLQDSSPPRFESLTRADGLSNLSVSSVVQDSKGFLYFGTQGGLNRYDGRNVTVFRHDPFDSNTLPHDLVQTLHYQTETETLWIGTYNGLSALELESGEFTNYPADEGGLSNSIVIAIESDRAGMIWIGTMRGIDRLDPKNGKITHLDVPGGVVRSLLVAEDGTLWAGTYRGLFYLPSEQLAAEAPVLESVDLELPSQAVMTIREDAPGVLQLGCWEGGVVTYDRRSGRTSLLELPDSRIYTVHETVDGILWVGTWGGGLFAVEPAGEVTHFSGGSEEKRLGNPIVYSLFQDSSDILWIGTNGGGLQKISPRKRDFRRFSHEPDDPRSLPQGKVNVITRDRAGDLWFGVYNGGLNRYDAEAEQMITYRHDPGDPTSLANDIVNDIYETRGGDFLVATHGGISRYTPATDAFELWGRDYNDEFPLADQIVYAIEEDRHGRLWIGTYNAGLARLDPQRQELETFTHDPDDPSSLSDNLVYDIHEDRQGRIWVATNNGLNLYAPGGSGFTRFTHSPDDRSSLSSNTVRKVYQDSQERIWIATVSGGLNRYVEDQGSFDHILASDGLASNILVSILEDDLGRLWVATHQGISIINPATGTITNLDENDGLSGVEFNPGAYRDYDGTLYFGAAHGVTGISESSTLRNPNAPRVHITDIRVLQRSLKEYRYSFNDASFSVAPDERLISFEFVALEFEAPERNEYAYMLKGFDREWIYSGSRNFASYTALPPGEYTFMVKASNNDDFWSPELATVQVEVQAPLWRQWWAFLIYGLLLIGVVLSSVRLRESRLIKQQNERLAEANAELERLSFHDPLTGIFNRRYFDSRLEEELAHARRSSRPLALLMLDLDHFKEYNDQHGHVAGDAVLVSFAKILNQEIQRRTDFACRYGGEEFAVVLFDTGREGAAEIASRIISAVRDIGVTVSIGIAVQTQAEAANRSDSLLEQADNALYTAKREGRDRYQLS